MRLRNKEVRINLDAGVGTAQPVTSASSTPISIPADKQIDVTKTPNMSKVGKYMITGGVFFAIGGILTGRSILKSALWGLAIGGAVGLMLSKGQSNATESSTEQEADKITDEVAGTMATEYNKLVAFAKANNPLTDAQKTKAQQIVTSLKNAGYSLLKQGESFIAVNNQNATSPTQTSTTGS